VEQITPPVVASRTDPFRCFELDLSEESAPERESSTGHAAGFRDIRIAHTHDLRRVSLHPLGLTSLPAGVSELFWRRLDPEFDAEEAEPESRAVVLAPVPTASSVPASEREAVAPKPSRRPSPSIGGAGAGRGGAGGLEREEGNHDSTEMPFLDHLEELRWSILKSIIVIVIAMIGSWYLSSWFYSQITELARGGKSFLGMNAVNVALAPLTGHEGKIAGMVTDLKTGKAIPGAQVKVTPGDYSVVTDSVGKYAIRGIPAGNYTVSVSKDGYTSGTKTSGMKLVMTTIMEPLMIRLQMALVMGIILALPLVFYFLWSFISPGLYANEKHWVLPLIFASLGCFFIGAALAWFIIIPYMLRFLQTFMPPDIDGMFTFGKFLGIILKFTLSFGLIFELPMVSFVLAKIGIVKYTFMAKYRGYALVIVFIISAVITPTVDPVSQTLMAIPLYLLYEVSILVARFAGKNTLM
jgi:sec-independent protein translocase protein TatC